jgi:hypothetical protein
MMVNVEWLDLKAFNALIRAESDPDMAAKALLIAATYFRANKPLPSHLGKFLADAIEASMNKPMENRNNHFLLELGLVALNRRPVKADWFEVGQAFEDRLDSGSSHNKAAKSVAIKFGISSSTANRLYKKYKDTLDNIEKDRIKNPDSYE